MKKHFFLFLTLASAMLSIFSRCKDVPNNPIDVKVCNPAECSAWTGQECVNGDCLCAKGKQRILGLCYGGGSDTTFVGVAKNTFWRDTVIFTIQKYLSNDNYLAFSIDAMDAKYGIPGTFGSEAYRLKDNIKGDSIHEVAPSDKVFIMPDNSFVFPEFKGRFLDSNTIRLHVTFCSHTSLGAIKNRIDSTTYIFRKIL